MTRAHQFSLIFVKQSHFWPWSIYDQSLSLSFTFVDQILYRWVVNLMTRVQYSRAAYLIVEASLCTGYMQFSRTFFTKIYQLILTFVDQCQSVESYICWPGPINWVLHLLTRAYQLSLTLFTRAYQLSLTFGFLLFSYSLLSQVCSI